VLIGGCKKAGRTYHWQEFGNGCKQEPNDTLLDGNHISEELHRPENVLPPHLFPKQSSQVEPTSTWTSKAKQANKHDKEQGKVRSKYRYEGWFVALDINDRAAAVVRGHHRPNLQIG